jgi:hypothetical protein
MNRFHRPRGVGAFCLAIALAVPLAVGATTWPVAPGGSIGDALGMAADGDTVLVACGTYQEQGLTLPDGVVLRSEEGLADCVTIATTGGESILACAAPGLTSRVEGITFAVAAGGLATPVTRGGGVLAVFASTVFADCRFEGLTAAYGGAVYSNGGGLTFDRCDFVQNRAAASGGALNAVGGAAPVLSGCLLVDNSAGVTGSAVNAALGAQPSLVSCTLVGNDASALAGWDAGALTVSRSVVSAGPAAFLGDRDSAPGIDCSDIWGNGADWTGVIADQATQAGNLSADPLFCPAGTSEEDYALADISPCAAAVNPCGLVGARAVGCDETVHNEGGEWPDDGAAPAVTRLHHSFPNPFNPVTTVRFDLRRAGRATVRVYDAAGRLVRCLLDEPRAAGTHDIAWQGRDDRGRTVAAGVYFIRLESDGLIDTQRVALVK